MQKKYEDTEKKSKRITKYPSPSSKIGTIEEAGYLVSLRFALHPKTKCVCVGVLKEGFFGNPCDKKLEKSSNNYSNCMLI